ncbi:MAG: cytochrome c oxidase, cbb3-type, CcoQ subunit [Epsilonproteobacteria bacterium]|nr:cytochrome c oxidase, cbb3-type, CcoQ subunit [Campylobacterota bacterium]
MSIAEIQAYGYFFLTLFMVLVLYGYIYHLYTKKKDADGIDYEKYGNIALDDDIGDAPVLPVSKDKEK